MSTKEIFDAFAEKYDGWYIRHRELYVSELKAASSFNCRGGLEIGIGTGRFAGPLGLRAGVDPSTAMLKLARGDLDLVAGVGERLPFREKAFPCALIVVTLCFADNPLDLMREAARVAERVVVCIVPRDSPWGVKYRREASAGHPFYSRARFYTVAEAVGFGEAAGLDLVSISATLKDLDEREQPVAAPDLREAEGYGFVCIELTRRRQIDGGPYGVVDGVEGRRGGEPSAHIG
ncbi:MAG: class I SAM-dependent methyltransferase [Thermoproteus sp.]